MTGKSCGYDQSRAAEQSVAGQQTRADEAAAETTFEEYPVEFHNQAVKLAGSLAVQMVMDEPLAGRL